MSHRGGGNGFTGGKVEPVVGDVYGIRQYRAVVEDDRVRLFGLSYAQEVVPGVNVSVCMEDERHPIGGSVPAPECTCGFYLYDRMLAWATKKKDIVDAVVRVSGKVVVCEDGLRAEELEVVGLVVDARRPRMQKQLKKAWGEVPVFTNWKNALEMFPVYPLSKGSSKRFSAWASAVGFLVVMTLMGWAATQGLDSAWHGFGLLGAAIALSWGAAIATKPLTRSRKSAVVLGFVWFLGSLSVLMIVFISVELALGVGLALIACVALSLWISLLWLDRFSWLYLSRGKPWLGFLFENLLASGVELLLVDGIELVIRRPLKVTQRALKVKQQSEKLLPARVRGVE